jgi:hypothetical protein
MKKGENKMTQHNSEFAGFVPVLTVPLSNTPGALEPVFKVFSQNNAEFAMLSGFSAGPMGFIAFAFKNPQDAQKVHKGLLQAGIFSRITDALQINTKSFGPGDLWNKVFQPFLSKGVNVEFCFGFGDTQFFFTSDQKAASEILKPFLSAKEFISA